MSIHTTDLAGQASHVFDRAADTGRGLLEARHGLLETGHGLLETGQGLLGTAGGLAGYAGGLAVEAGGRAGEVGGAAVRAGGNAAESIADTAAEQVPPAVEATVRAVRQNPLLAALVGVALVALIVAVKRRRTEHKRQARLRSVSMVSEPSPSAQPVPR